MHVFSLGRFCASPKPSPRGEDAELCSPDAVEASRPLRRRRSRAASCVISCFQSSMLLHNLSSIFLSERKPARPAQLPRPAPHDRHSAPSRRNPTPRRSPANRPAPHCSPASQPAPHCSPASRPAPRHSQANRPAPRRSPASRPAPHHSSANRPAPRRSPANRPAPHRSPANRPAPRRSPVNRPTPRRSSASLPSAGPIPRRGRFSTGFPQSFPHFRRFPTAAFFPLGFLGERQGQIF